MMQVIGDGSFQCLSLNFKAKGRKFADDDGVIDPRQGHRTKQLSKRGAMWGRAL